MRVPVRDVVGTWHVAVFAALPFLLVYAGSIAIFPIPVRHLLIPAALATAFAAAVLLAFSLWCRDTDRAATATSLMFLGASSFLFTATLGGGYWFRSGRPGWLLAVFHILLAIGLAFVALRSRGAVAAGHWLRIAACGLCVSIGLQAVIVGARPRPWLEATDEIRAGGAVALREDMPTPDIIHVVFDGLASPAVLRHTYGIDTASSVAQLTRRGFNVMDTAVANYPYTYLSLASMLNASYLTPLGRFAELEDRAPLAYLIDGATVIRTLKTAGYSFTLIASNYGATVDSPLADTCHCDSIGLTELESAVYRLSPLRLWTLNWLTYEPFRRKLRYQLDALRTVPTAGPPQYVLAHLVLPHPPFAFDAEGGLPPGPLPLFGMQDGPDFPGSPDEYKMRYRAQARFALSTMMELAEGLSRRPRPALVIFAGDHGPAGGFSHDNVRATDLAERFGAFVALSIPGAEPQPSVTSLVNLYRVVFRHAFRVDIDDLPKHTFFTPYSRPYQFTSVEVEGPIDPAGGQ